MRRTQHQHVQPGGPQLIRGAPAELRWWAWLLDGAHPWGSFDAMVSRYGVRRYRLIIYPPGTTTADRRLARLWRGWPLGGVALAHDRRRYTEWQTLIYMLTRADQMLKTGAISPVEHEAIWWEASVIP